ncbi:MAG: c-type cytochrome [Nitrospinota bacterium]
MHKMMFVSTLTVFLAMYYGHAAAHDHWSGLPESARQQLSLTERFLVGESIPYDPVTFRPPENKITVAAGKVIYDMRCAVCHGLKGDGKGSRADELEIMPRDFTLAIFKFRSTPAGALPTDEDIFQTLSRGMHGTGMLPWFGLAAAQRWLTVYYVKSISGLFEGEEIMPAVKVPEPTMPPIDYVELGKKVYEKAKCYECHGKEGRGDGEKADKLKDDWFKPIRLRNFREEILKRGLEIEDIYLTVATGLDGTPMDSQSKALSEEEMLAVSYYVQSLAPPVRRVGGRRYLRGDITADERAALDIDHHMGVRFRWPWDMF